MPLLRQSIVDSHADLSNVVSSHFAVWLQQIPLEHQTRLGQQCNQFVVRHAFPFDLQTAHRRIHHILCFCVSQSTTGGMVAQGAAPVQMRSTGITQVAAAAKRKPWVAAGVAPATRSALAVNFDPVRRLN